MKDREDIKQGEPSTIEDKLGIRELKDCICLSDEVVISFDKYA